MPIRSASLSCYRVIVFYRVLLALYFGYRVIVFLSCYFVLALDRLCQMDWATQNNLRNEHVEDAPLGLCFMKRAHEILDSRCGLLIRLRNHHKRSGQPPGYLSARNENQAPHLAECYQITGHNHKLHALSPLQSETHQTRESTLSIA